MFRRRRQSEPPADNPADPDAPRTDETAPAEPVAADPGAAEPPVGAPTGPRDAADVSAAELAGMLDLGALRVPALPGIEIRLDLQDQHVLAVSLVDGRSSVQVAAFAAPKTSGIWAEVREEIVQSIRGSGGAVEPATGPLGPELRARLPMQPPGSQTPVLQPARFVGVDGPRWFVRGLFSGPAATDPPQAHRLEEAFRALVVVRGGEAMAPRDQIPLRPPAGVEAAPTAPAEDFNPFRRGPEITEVR